VARDLLPTPRATDGVKFAQGKRNLDDAIALLPTPTATNANGNEFNNYGALLLPGVVRDLSTGGTTSRPSGGTSS
jgi:hypothetical protein